MAEDRWEVRTWFDPDLRGQECMGIFDTHNDTSELAFSMRATSRERAWRELVDMANHAWHETAHRRPLAASKQEGSDDV